MKDVKIKISVDSKGAEKKVKSLGKEVKKTTTETGKAGGALSKGFAGLGGAIGGVTVTDCCAAAATRGCCFCCCLS